MLLGLLIASDYGRAQRISESTARQRAEQLVAKMTLPEKIAQLRGVQSTTEYRIVPGFCGAANLCWLSGPDRGE